MWIRKEDWSQLSALIQNRAEDLMQRLVCLEIRMLFQQGFHAYVMCTAPDWLRRTHIVVLIVVRPCRFCHDIVRYRVMVLVFSYMYNIYFAGGDSY